MKHYPKGPNAGTPYVKEGPLAGVLVDNIRLSYIMRRAFNRATRFQLQRERRLSGWDLDMMQHYPVPGLQRELTKVVKEFDEEYYCVASCHYCETLPDNHPQARYWGQTVYRVEVFYDLEDIGHPTSTGEYPRVACVDCLTVRGLRQRLHTALTALGPHYNPVGLLMAGEGWHQHLEKLILDPLTAPATRAEAFRWLLKRLTVGEAQHLSQTLEQGIANRQPGMPGYAAMHGLHTEAQA